MANKLSLGPRMHFRSTAAYADPKKQVLQHQVQGLPEGQKALIGESNRKWKILRTKDGVTGDWYGEYATADEALIALEAAVEKEVTTEQ
jgi:hypothetical protein